MVLSTRSSLMKKAATVSAAATLLLVGGGHHRRRGVANAIEFVDDFSRNYAVYFDPEQEPDRNPKGFGWNPVPPSDWGSVDKQSYEKDFFNWEERESADIEYDGNECENRDISLSKNEVDITSSGKHKQSPTIVQKDGKCKDNHGMMYDLGNCKKSDVLEISVNSYGLRHVFKRCEFRIDIDVSECPSPWAFMGLEIKSPSEHAIRVKGSDTYKTYDGEIYLLHRGGGDKNDDKALIVSIMLEAGNYTANAELEKYLQDWEAKQSAQYQSCGVQFDEDTCSLLPVMDVSDEGGQGTDETGEGAAVDDFTVGIKIQHGAEEASMSSPNTSTAVEQQPVVSQRGGARTLRLRTLRDKYRVKDDENIRTTYGGKKDKRGDSGRLLKKDKKDKKKQTRKERYEAEAALAATADYTPYNLWIDTGNKHFYKAIGSITNPPCTEGVEWRVMRVPLQIPYEQMNRIDNLIARHINDLCQLATVGAYRNDGTCHVNVNRPLQYPTESHDLVDCDDWAE